MSPPIYTADDLSPEERRIVEAARADFAKGGGAPSKNLAAKMQAEQEVTNAGTARVEGKKKAVREANKAAE